MSDYTLAEVGVLIVDDVSVCCDALKDFCTQGQKGKVERPAERVEGRHAGIGQGGL